MTEIETSVRLPSWLDERTASLVRAIVASVAARHLELRAAILYGSIARHDERPLTDAAPSAVDLLLLFDLEPAFTRLPYERLGAIYESVGVARECYPQTPREVQVTLAVCDLADWDRLFVENLARDGLLLWACVPLPVALASIERRAAQAI